MMHLLAGLTLALAMSLNMDTIVKFDTLSTRNRMILNFSKVVILIDKTNISLLSHCIT